MGPVLIVMAPAHLPYTAHTYFCFCSCCSSHLLEGGHGQCFRLSEGLRVAIPVLQRALRALATRADGLALVPHEETRRIAEKQLCRTQTPTERESDRDRERTHIASGQAIDANKDTIGTRNLDSSDTQNKTKPTVAHCQQTHT